MPNGNVFDKWLVPNTLHIEARDAKIIRLHEAREESGIEPKAAVVRPLLQTTLR